MRQDKLVQKLARNNASMYDLFLRNKASVINNTCSHIHVLNELRTKEIDIFLALILDAL